MGRQSGLAEGGQASGAGAGDAPGTRVSGGWRVALWWTALGASAESQKAGLAAALQGGRENASRPRQGAPCAHS